MRKIKNNSSQNTSKQRLYYIAFKNNFRLVLLGKSHFIFFSTDILIFTYPAKKIICDYSTLFFRVVYRFQTVIWHFGCFPSSRMVSNSTCHRIFTLSSNADLWNLKVACVHVVSVFVFTYKQLTKKQQKLWFLLRTVCRENNVHNVYWICQFYVVVPEVS